MTQIPQTVLDRVGGAIARLHEIRQRLDESRALDERFGGAGRYESEAHTNRADDISWALAVLAKFEAAAGAKGFETGPIYAGFGGVPISLFHRLPKAMWMEANHSNGKKKSEIKQEKIRTAFPPDRRKG
jgi:hypothetical protein